MLRAYRAWVCAAGCAGVPIALVSFDVGETLAFGLAAAILLLCGGASPWLIGVAALPLFQLLPAPPPGELAEAMIAAGVSGPGTIAADPAALGREALVLTGCLCVFALARAAARNEAAVWWAVAGIAVFGCFEGASGVASGVGATPASGSFVNRGQYAALLELTFGAGCGLAAAAWAGRAWRERLEEKALAGAALGCAAAALSLAGIALSLSRTGIVAGSVAALAAAFWFGRKRVWALAVAGLVVIGLAALAPRALDRFEQLSAAGGDPGRSAVWADSLDLARVSWRTGVGLGSFPAAFRRSSVYLPRKSIDNAHSEYLEWLVELGAPACALLLGALAFAAAGAVRRAAASALAAGCAIGAAAALLHAAVDLPLQNSGVAALLAAMLGLASPARGGRERMGAGLLAVLLMALALAPRRPPAELYQAAAQAAAAGDRERAVELYRSTLDRNLLAAPAWLRLAEIERARGEPARALAFFRAARAVEPFTLRTEWPLAELELELGAVDAATERLSSVVAAAPDLLDAALHTASRSGADPASLLRLTPPRDPESAGRFLAFLVRSGASHRLPEAYAALGAPELPAAYSDWLAREAGFRP